MERDERSIAVVGGGIVGICSALYLQEKNFKVHVIDRAVKEDERASFGNAGILSPWSCVPESVPGLWKSVPGWVLDPLGPMVIRAGHLPAAAPWLLRFLKAGRRSGLPALADALRSLYAPTLDLYQDLLRGTGSDNLVRRCVYVHVYRQQSNASLDTLGSRLRIERGADLRVISAGELQEIEPDISPDYKKAIVIQGQGRTTNPNRLLQVLTQRMLRQGGRISRAEVKSLHPTESGVRIQTGDGEIRDSRVLVATGAWTRKLLQPLGLNVPLEDERGYHLTLRDPGITINNTVMDAERMIAGNSMEMGLRLAGTVELAGLTAPPDYRRSRNLAVLGKNLFPKLNVEAQSEWMGHRPSLPDSLPIIGAMPDQPNILLAFGHSHLGMAGGAPTGRLIAQIAAGETPAIDMAPFRADRFA